MAGVVATAPRGSMLAVLAVLAYISSLDRAGESGCCWGARAHWPPRGRELPTPRRVRAGLPVAFVAPQEALFSSVFSEHRCVPVRYAHQPKGVHPDAQSDAAWARTPMADRLEAILGRTGGLSVRTWKN